MKFFKRLHDNWENLAYNVKHKWNIIGPGRDLDVPWGQLLKHDLSKFTPSEWGPYRDFFFSDKGLQGDPNNVDPEVYKKFKKAIKHHYEHNPHHTKKYPKQSEITTKHKLESIADQYSAGKTQAKDKKFPDFKTWYKSQNISNDLKPLIEKRLGINNDKK